MTDTPQASPASPAATYRIAHIDTGMELRGGQRQLLLLARGLRERGHSQLIVCPEGSRLEADARRDAFPVLTLPRHDPGHAHGTAQLRGELRRKPVRILHAHDGRGQSVGWLASAGMPLRRIASRRVTFLPRGLSSLFATHGLKYRLTCHGVIAVSAFVRDLLVRSGVPAARIEVIPDGVEVPPAPDVESRTRVRAEWGCGAREFVVGQLGALSPEKGQDVALAAVLQLKSKLPQARLVLAGDNPKRLPSAISTKLQQANSHARFLGQVENVAEFLAGLDLFIMPSMAEGLGSAALLAMSYGLPVVASRIGGLPEVVEEGTTGWLVPSGSATALAEAIAEAASDPERLRQFGAAGRARALRFSTETMVQRTEAFYWRLLGDETTAGHR